jgi:uncharacterized protein (DUF488 family)
MALVYTIGHGTRTIPELTEVLHAGGVRLLIDVRRYPGSRRHPHFARQALERSMPELGVVYEWRGEELGGRRTAGKEASRHLALRNKGFRSYADHMDTRGFEEALKRLEADAAQGGPLAIMCAETLWWRCHRKMIADALVLHGVSVVHLISPGNSHEHELDACARADERGRPVYDVGAAAPLDL